MALELLKAVNYRLPNAPVPTAEVFGDAVALCTTSFRAVLPLALTGAAASSVPRLFGFGLPELGSGGIALVDLTFLLWMLPFQLVSVFFLLAVTAQMHATALGEELAPSRALVVALGRTPAFAVALATVSAVMFAIVALAVLLATGVVFAALEFGPPEFAQAYALVPIFTTLIALVLALPVVTVLVYWYFGFLLVVTENLGGLAALRRSGQLVRGHLWRMKLALSVVFLVALAFVGVAESLGLAASEGLGALGAPGFAGDLAAFVFAAIGGTLAVPVSIAGALALLRDLTLRHGHKREARMPAA